jgi:alkaline phosphatase
MHVIRHGLHLDQPRPGSEKGKNKGFVLQVESASIDKRDHAADPCGQIGETVAFDEAVQKALEFAQKDGNTLVIATADHSHISQIAEPYSEEDLRGIAEDKKRIAAYGPRGANVVALTDQSDLFFTMTDALGLNRS